MNAHDVLDLRSDFVSRPTEAMIEAMTRAARRRGGFGLREDAEVQQLEALAARLLGKEDALFVPSCAMANQVAIHLHCRPGGVLIAEADSHVCTSEAGAPAALSGVTCRGIPGRNGVADLAAVGAALSEGDAQRSPVDLLVIENTHVRSGGSVLSLETTAALAAAAASRGVPVHLDGSRIFNAAAALGVEARQLCGPADSVSLSLNKGLAAPLGAILAGSRRFIGDAVRVRQMFGGGWRPAGIPAAAATVALETMPRRLGEDHAVAQRIARELGALDGLRLAQEQVRTNLVLLDVDPRLGTAAAFAAVLARHGVLALAFGPQRLRLAVYYEITLELVPRIAGAFVEAIRECG